ncbi:Glutamyl-tRNA(Gln) amidotransferase subunit A, mitochondrial [Nymphon striatum]|nr:Glutamyl-tRNA(Gln) amidotransferase subunit A, mitochondrial [Nymphon striatum]KAG1665522.1 Glutamyl-tRNA(Gln) amidotransferase subunit A, mitochondrial [Nymphon striatum]
MIMMGPEYDVELHPGVSLSKDSTPKAPRARVIVKLLAAGQWIPREAGIAELLKSGSISSTELCELCIQRAEKTKFLNSYVLLTAEKCRQQSQLSDERIQKGTILSALDGIPISIKDNFNLENVTTTCGSKMLANYVSPYTATVVQKLIDNGGTIMGKTNMDEFAMGSDGTDSAFGNVKNIWKLNVESKFSNPSSIHSTNELNASKLEDYYIPGGSSSGSAVSVASGSCFASIGSDTGGSVRVPAAHCGLVGLKPTYGTVSRYGLISLVNSLDVPGIFSRSVDDAATMLGIISGYDENDSTTIPDFNRSIQLPDDIKVSTLTVGIPQEYYLDIMSDELRDIWARVADLLEQGGANVIPVSLPHSKYSLLCYTALNCCEIASNMARYDGLEFGLRADVEESTNELMAATRHAGFNQIVRQRILTGNYLLVKKNYEDYFNQALKVRRLIKNDFDEIFKEKKVDLLLTPMTVSEPCKFSEISGKNRLISDFYAAPVNMAGVCAVSIPVTLSRNNLPIGLQLIADNFQEEKLLSAAKYIENIVKFKALDLCL